MRPAPRPRSDQAARVRADTPATRRCCRPRAGTESRAGRLLRARALQLLHLAHFDVAAVLQMRAALGDAAGLGVVARGDDKETADDLLALGIRSVGRGQAAAIAAQD